MTLWDRCTTCPSQLDRLQPTSLWLSLDDAILEEEELFNFADDSLTVQFAESSYCASEGAVEVVLNLTANGTSAVNYTVVVTMDGSATGEHYVSLWNFQLLQSLRTLVFLFCLSVQLVVGNYPTVGYLLFIRGVVYSYYILLILCMWFIALEGYKSELQTVLSNI